MKTQRPCFSLLFFFLLLSLTMPSLFAQFLDHNDYVNNLTGRGYGTSSSSSKENFLNSPYTSCEESKTEKPPFYISTGYRQSTRLSENLRSLKNKRRTQAYLPRGSIVQVDPELVSDGASSKYRVPVRVIEVTDKSLENELKGRNRVTNFFKRMSWTRRNLPRAEAGDVGFLSPKSLKPADKFTFIIKEDSPLYDRPELRNRLNVPLTLKMDGDQFLGKYCCRHKSRYDEDPVCFFRYTYQAIDKNREIISEFQMGNCHSLEDLVPITNRNGIFESIQNILDNLDREYPGFGIGKGTGYGDDVKFSGLRFLPEKRWDRSRKQTITRELMIRIPIDKETKEGPYGSFHYNADDENSNDAFLQPASLCAFMEVLKKFQRECREPGCQVQFGDLFHKASWGKHASHGDGTCIDIRPFRRNSDTDAALHYESRNYDREKTQRFIHILREAGGRPIYFNDPGIRGIGRVEGHGNHIHVCFKPKRDQVKEACNKGL